VRENFMQGSVRGESGNRLSYRVACDTKSCTCLYRCVFFEQSIPVVLPTVSYRQCVAGNGGVRSVRDNVALRENPRRPSRERRSTLPASRWRGTRMGRYGEQM
jgi:hypothetical protein